MKYKKRFHWAGRSGSETGLETKVQHSELHPPSACEVQSVETQVQQIQKEQ